MTKTEMILAGVVVIGGFALYKRNGGLSASVSLTPAQRQQTASQRDTQAAGDWLNLGAQATNLYRSIMGQPPLQTGGNRLPSAPPSADDTLMANPPGNVDPYDFELNAWGYNSGYAE